MKIFRIFLQLSGLAYFVWRLYNPDGMVSADPVTLLMIGMGTQAAGQIQAGRVAASEAESAKRVSDYNAAVEIQKAKARRAKGKFEQVQQAKRAGEKMSELQLWRAGTGATGSGLLEEEQEAELELEGLLIGYEAEVEAQQAESQAELDKIKGKLAKRRGKAAKKAGYLGAGATILTGFGMAGMGGGTTSTAKATYLRY
jgi:hypothetical protein